MRLTLEQLKAMDDKGLRQLWELGSFPFEWLDCCVRCMTQHTYTSNICEVVDHQVFVAEAKKILGLDWSPTKYPIQELRGHLDELYALRIFYDHLYQQQYQLSKAEQTEQEKVNV